MNLIMVPYNDVHVYYTLEYIIIGLVEQYAFDTRLDICSCSLYA